MQLEIRRAFAKLLARCLAARARGSPTFRPETMSLAPKLRVVVAVLAAIAAAPLVSSVVPLGDSPGIHAQESVQDTALPVAREELRDTAPLPIEGQQPEAATRPTTGFMATVDRYAGVVNSWIGAFFFYDLVFWDDTVRLPFVVLWLVVAAVFLTIRMGFINLRAFRHSVNITAGKYTDPKEKGEVSHFQALSAALSATVGLGNIAGVAIAVSIGGPGATFWMILAGLLGMTSKFTECTLGQQYRHTRPDGRIMGGAMYYLSQGLAEKNLPRLGKFLAIFFCILCIGGSFGGGNAFQVNQSMNAVQESLPFLSEVPWVYGLIMAVLVGIVIIGGIRRIADVASRIVPTMIGIYILAAIVILIDNVTAIPAAFAAIFRGAITPDAAYGGFIGALVVGFQRAAFSNEAGAGSAAIAHSAAKTEYPVREGIVALLEPFIDTVVVCTMTALVIVITGAYNNPAYADIIANRAGAALTSRAMGEHLTFFPYILSACVLLFAYSTMISWSYYGERCWAYMFGDATSQIYRVLFVIFVFLGSVITSVNVLEFGDLMILGMAIPNLLGVYILHGKVKGELDGYWSRYKAGAFPRYK